MLIKLPLELRKSCYFIGHRNNVKRWYISIVRSRGILKVGEATSVLEFFKETNWNRDGTQFAKVNLSLLK